MVRILKENIEICGSERIRKEVDRLMAKTQSLLIRERKCIAAPFKDIQTKVPVKKAMPSFFKSMLRDPGPEKARGFKAAYYSPGSEFGQSRYPGPGSVRDGFDPVHP